jgi:hypothetical protein
MTKERRRVVLCSILALVIPLLAQPPKDPQTPDFAKGDFFIVSSIDLGKRQVLLKRPTEVTELMRVDSGTHYFDEHGKPIRLTDLRAGDTVYIVANSSAGQLVALTISKGPMTLGVLRERYLKRSQ